MLDIVNVCDVLIVQTILCVHIKSAVYCVLCPVLFTIIVIKVAVIVRVATTFCAIFSSAG